ncbi:MAG TPA: hypothetical protein VK658_15580 [Chryseolinea sp.]|nr:hypothetical protein [Chryseolinea sp.]
MSSTNENLKETENKRIRHYAKDPETLNQYFRQMAPTIGGFDPGITADATSKLFDKIGQRILVTSQL